MAVVAAGVHPPGLAAGEVEPGRLVDRERVHVAAKQHGAARPRAVERGDEAAGRCAVADRQRQAGERLLELVAGSRRVEPKFGIGMDRAAQRDQRVGIGGGAVGPVGEGRGRFIPAP